MESGDGNQGVGFLQCLPPGSFLSPFTYFHESGRERPETGFGFDSTAAQKHLSFPFRDAPSDNFWIMIMNSLAGIADEPGQIISRGDLLRNWFSTFAAIVHKLVPTFCSIIRS